MTIKKAKILGCFYFFLVSYAMLAPLAYGFTYVHVLNEVAETDMTYNSDGDLVTSYRLETVNEEGWALLKQERRSFINIICLTALICSGLFGTSFGEDVILNKKKASHTWDARSVMSFSSSFLIAALIWHISFILNLYGFSFLIVGKILYGALINTAAALTLGGALAVFAGEAIIHGLLSLHIPNN